MRIVAGDAAAGFGRQVADEQRRAAGRLPCHVRRGFLQRVHQTRASEVMRTLWAIAHEARAADGQLFGFGEHALIGHADGAVEAGSERRGRAEAPAGRSAQASRSAPRRDLCPSPRALSSAPRFTPSARGSTRECLRPRRTKASARCHAVGEIQLGVAHGQVAVIDEGLKRVLHDRSY